MVREKPASTYSVAKIRYFVVILPRHANRWECAQMNSSQELVYSSEFSLGSSVLLRSGVLVTVFMKAIV